MKISEMIENLKEFKEEHGDIEVWYAADGEGNEYHPIYFTPTLYYTNGRGDVYGNMEDFDMDDYIEDIERICIVN